MQERSKCIRRVSGSNKKFKRPIISVTSLEQIASFSIVDYIFKQIEYSSNDKTIYNFEKVSDILDKLVSDSPIIEKQYCPRR